MCGDGVVNGTAGEGCEEGAVETATCDPDCTTPACGDGYVNTLAGEPCDGDGMGVGGESATCNSDCSVSMCGDGLTNAAAGEMCDGDGAGNGGETSTCDADCSTSVCGDGTRNTTAGEVCDDGNMVNDDVCSNVCQPNGFDYRITGLVTFNTDTGVLGADLAEGWDAATSTWNVASLDVPAGATLVVDGSEPLRIRSGGLVNIGGTVDLLGDPGDDSLGCNSDGGAGGQGGPGGGAGGDGGGSLRLAGLMGSGRGAGFPGTGDDASGGGAGHLTMGVAGLAEGLGMAGAGGPSYAVGLVEGGSGGGGGSADDDSPAGADPGDDGGGGGGGGGGGILIEAYGDIRVTGVIAAAGGDGGEGTCSSGDGGGGSGGSIILYAAGALDFASGVLNVRGGAGDTFGNGVGSDGEVITGPIPTCSDGIQNQDETDTDCGGSVCAACL